VGIQHPRELDAYLSLTQLAGQCLATSGDYATKLSADGRHHHLFDPRSGNSPNELASVSIAADTALAADALSTAAFVLGLDKGAALVERSKGASALFVTTSERVLVTPGFPVA
jgi:thiamine biosynthesis lipoprotein